MPKGEIGRVNRDIGVRPRVPTRSVIITVPTLNTIAIIPKRPVNAVGRIIKNFPLLRICGVGVVGDTKVGILGTVSPFRIIQPLPVITPRATCIS